MGKNKYIETPEKLWELFEEYKNTIELIEVQVPHVKLGVVSMNIKAPMTMEGFKTFGHQKDYTIDHYVKNSDKAYDEYCPIVTRIKDEIYSHNFNRAALGVFKENLIAKQLGMVDKTENKNENIHKGKVQIEVIKSDIPLANNEKDINV